MIGADIATIFKRFPVLKGSELFTQKSEASRSTTA
jgi:hypothetical protein